MAILVNKDTRVVVQGITGREGRFQTHLMLEYGTQVVAGMTPGKGGEWVEDNVPVFDTVQAAVTATAANTSIIYVPGPGAADAIYEAIDAGIALIICISDPVPLQDMMRVREYLDRSGSRLIGPNCPGLLSAKDRVKVGIIPGYVSIPGNVGVVSRSGTLTYEVVNALTQRGVGQSTCIGIGGDPVRGLGFIDVLQMFEDDPETEKVVMIGEIGGTDEQKAAEFIRDHMTKPVVSFIAGRTAPPGRTMGHAGALIEGGVGSAEDKIKALQEAGVKVAMHPEQIPDLI